MLLAQQQQRSTRNKIMRERARSPTARVVPTTVARNCKFDNRY
jgi:hypothetical protein